MRCGERHVILLALLSNGFHFPEYLTKTIVRVSLATRDLVVREYAGAWSTTVLVLVQPNLELVRGHELDRLISLPFPLTQECQSVMICRFGKRGLWSAAPVPRIEIRINRIDFMQRRSTSLHLILIL